MKNWKAGIHKDSGFSFLFFFFLILALFGGILFSLNTGGRSDVNLSDLAGLMFSPEESLGQLVMRDIRLPRTVIAGLLGVSLGLAGLALQAVTRNPLASPSILGVNQGAALGLTLGIIFPNFTIISPGIMAVLGAVAAGFLTFGISGGFHGQVDSLRLILGGVAVGAFSYAMVHFAYTLEDDIAHQIVRWTVGDITDVRWPAAQRLILWVVPGFLASLALSHRFNLMALGRAAAHGLGADPRTTLFLGTLLAAGLSGISVTVAGPIAFVGLVVPHMCGLIFGSDHRVLVPMVSLCGAVLMLIADGLSKWISAPIETPIGVIAALIGAPYFLYQTISSGKQK